MLYNTKILQYEDSIHVEFFTSPIKRTVPKEEDKITDVPKTIPIIEDLQKDLIHEKNREKSLNTSVNRSKNNLYRIARSNTWEWFVTFTFDRKDDNKFGHRVIDSSNYDEVSKAVSYWCNSIKKVVAPELKYLIVPEFHKDKEHYHLHGLFANTGDLNFVFSGHYDDLGSESYNLTDWYFGFSYCSKIKDNARVTSYIGKYITKDLMNKLKYKKRYYASLNCNVADEELYYIHPDDLYKLFDPEDWSYIKTVNAGGYNQVKYIEIPLDNEH